MAGSNPYIKAQETRLPGKKYTITFIDEEGKETRVEVDPLKIPYDRTGRPGSILEIALGNGIEIDHACGGVCACATCHVKVKQGAKSLNEPTDDELDQLDAAPDLRPNSRLGCQSVPDGTADIIVEIPSWNRNLIKEGE